MYDYTPIIVIYEWEGVLGSRPGVLVLDRDSSKNTDTREVLGRLVLFCKFN